MGIRRRQTPGKMLSDELASRLRKNDFCRCSRTLLLQIESSTAVIRGHEIYYLRQALGEASEQEFWRSYHNLNITAEAAT